MATTTVPIYSTETNRLKTFAQVLTGAVLPAISLAAAGWVQPSLDNEEQNIVWCPFCDIKLTFQNAGHNPFLWHRILSGNCPFIKNNKHVNVRDLGIAYRDATVSAAELPNVISRSNPQTDSSMEDDDIYETQHMSSGMDQDHDDGHITLSHDVQSMAEDHGQAGTSNSNAEELNKLYRRQNQLKEILPKPHIEVLKKPNAQIIPQLSTFNYERHRRLTFAAWPKKETVNPRALASTGFIYVSGTEDTVECVFCKIRISRWTADMVPDEIHRNKSVHCQFMQGSKTAKNIPDPIAVIFDDEPSALPSGDQRMELGIITESSKYPDFAVETRRKETFLTWPAANHKLASEMFEHQLFYTGRGDVVCCFSCGTEMSGWTSTENIWRRHARQAPQCQLLIQEKGSDWVAQVIEEHGRFRTPEREPKIATVTTRMLRPRMDNPATQNVLMMRNPEYKREEIRNTLIHNIKYGGSDYMNRSDLVKAMLKRREEKRQLESVRREIEEEAAPPIIVSQPRSNVDEPMENDHMIDSNVQPPTITQEPAAAPAVSSEAAPMAGEHRPPEAEDSQPSLGPRRAPSPIANPTDVARVMRAQLTCKICMDAPVGIAFLPCGHMVCCPSCAPAMVQCPLCRQDVRGTVRVYLDKL